MAAEHNTHRARLTAALALCALAGCASSPSLSTDASAPVDRGAPVDAGPLVTPTGLTAQDGGALFALNTTDRVITLAVEGDGQHQLQGVLTDELGRRELRYVGADGRAEVLAPSDWNLPPAAAVVRGGSVMACFNVLTGGPSSNTAGAMPDPSRSMVLRCRVRTAQGWGAPTDLPVTTRGAWVQRVVAREDGGFRVLIYGDDGFFIAPPSAHHGIYDATWTDGRWSDVRFVMPAPQD